MEITRYTHSYRLLAFLAVICSIAAMARVSGDALLFAVSVAGLTTGHLYVWRTGYAVSRVRTSVFVPAAHHSPAFIGPGHNFLVDR